MSDISAKYWVPGMAIAVLATLYATYKMIPVQQSTYAAQAAPVADPKLERINREKANVIRTAQALKACQAKYSYFDCEAARTDLENKVQALDCAMSDAAYGDPEREKLHRRWQQDMIVEGGALVFASGRCEEKP